MTPDEGGVASKSVFGLTDTLFYLVLKTNPLLGPVYMKHSCASQRFQALLSFNEAQVAFYLHEDFVVPEFQSIVN